jgi:hypothetical protein
MDPVGLNVPAEAGLGVATGEAMGGALGVAAAPDWQAPPASTAARIIPWSLRLSIKCLPLPVQSSPRVTGAAAPLSQAIASWINDG